MNLKESIQWAKDKEIERKLNPKVCSNPNHAGICFDKNGLDLNGRNW
jgi:hypothetical protein